MKRSTERKIRSNDKIWNIYFLYYLDRYVKFYSYLIPLRGHHLLQLLLLLVQFFLSVQSFSYKPRGLLDLFLLRLFVAARPPLLPFVVFLPENHDLNLSFDICKWSSINGNEMKNSYLGYNIKKSHCFKTNQLNNYTYNIDIVIRTGVASKTISHVGKLSSKPKQWNTCFGISWPMSSIHHWIYQEDIGFDSEQSYLCMFLVKYSMTMLNISFYHSSNLIYL